MDKISSLFKKDKIGEIILITIFILYLIFGFQTPPQVAKQVNTMYGKIIIFIIIIGLFLFTNPLLGIIGLLVGFELIRRSKMGGINSVAGNYQKYIPCEESKNSPYTAHHQFGYTLEQEVVKKMAPIKQNGSTLAKPSYKPFLENLHDATPITNSN